MTRSPSTPRPLLPVLLGCLALSMGLFLLWRLTSAPPARPHPPTPPRCTHWIALRGAFASPRVVCWRSSHTAPTTDDDRRWRRLLRQARPRCHLPAALPIPLPGHQLVLVAQKTQPCLVRIHVMRGNTRIALGIPLQINRDSADDLAAIPGLSPRLAQRIVAYRRQHGPFQTIQELVQVKGIGRKTVRKLKPYLIWKKIPRKANRTP